jgi:hypothetical protein
MSPSALRWPGCLTSALAALLCLAGCGSCTETSEEKPGEPNPIEQRKQRAASLHRIGRALHNYHDDNKTLPPAYLLDRNGKPGLSWRVAILPYLDQEDLYKQFRLDEPWDSEHNIQLLERMPKIYAPIAPTKEKHVTYSRVFVGDRTAFPAGNKQNRGRSLEQITDGTSNTFLVVEAGEAVPWTKPDELPFDANKVWRDMQKAPEAKDVPKLGGQFTDGFYAVMCDGAVHFFRKETPPRVLAALIVYNDGLAIDWGSYTGRGKSPER